MQGLGENFRHRAFLHHAAGVHHDHFTAVFGDHSEVVGDQHHRHVHLGAESCHEVEDLCLHGHIECGGGFVGNHQRGSACECESDHHPLAHAAGKLVRVFHHAFFRRRNADQLEHFERLVPCVVFGNVAVQQKHLRDLAADAVQRVQCRHRLLKDHADLAAANFSHAIIVGAQQVLAFEPHMPANDSSRRLWQQPDDRHRGHAFAAARFAHDAHGATGGD